jgi:Tol biopolymer transport system component
LGPFSFSSAALVLTTAAACSVLGPCRTSQPPLERQDGLLQTADPVAGEVAWELVYDQVVDGNVDLYLATAGRLPRRLTEDPSDDLLGRFMPDGRSIVFTSGRSGRAGLWTMSRAGGDPHRIRPGDAVESQPDPSPDSRHLAFISDAPGSDALVMLDLETHRLTELVRHPDGSIFGNPDWSPDGSRVVFSSSWPDGHQIYVVDVATREVRPLSGDRTPGCEPRFSPDGRRVAYVDRGNQSPTSRLVEYDPGSRAVRTLVDWPALNYDLAYSPDGGEIAFASNIAGEWAIYRQRLSDGRAWRVSLEGGPARNPDYRPTSGGREDPIPREP